MHILIGTHIDPLEPLGGAERVAWRLACDLAPRHEVTLFHPMGTPGRETVPSDHGGRGTDVANTPLPVGAEHVRRRHGVRLVGRRFTPPARFRQTYQRHSVERWFTSLLERFRPDVCHLHHLTGLSLRLPPLARRFRVPTVLTLHDYWTLCGRGQFMNLEFERCTGPTTEGCARCLADQIALDSPIARWTNELATRCLPPTRLEQMKRLYLRGRAIGSRGRTVVIGGGVRGPSMQRARERLDAGWAALEACTLLTGPSEHIVAEFEALGIPAHKLRHVSNGTSSRPAHPPSVFPAPPLVLGFLGAMIPTKGPQVLLEAMNRLRRRDVRLRMAGPAPLFHRAPRFFDDLEARARALNVRLEGVLPKEGVSRFLSEIHLLVVPSIWPENAPLVVDEALRLGVPVIGSRVGGIPERVRDDINGITVPPGNPGAIAEVLKRLCARPDVLERWRKGAWESALGSHEVARLAWERIYLALRSPKLRLTRRTRTG